MAHHLLLNVAVSNSDVIIFIVAAIVMIGNWMARKSRQAGKPARTSSPLASAREARLQELAARRRQQLREMAARSSSQPHMPPVASTSQHSQAKTLYERRAEALRLAQAKKPAPPHRNLLADSLETQRRAAAEARVRAQRAAAQQQARAQAQALRQHQAQEAQRRQQEVIRQTRQREQVARQRQHRQGQLMPDGRREYADVFTESDVHRHVRDSDASAYAIQGRRVSDVRQTLKSRRSLRHAIILTEVFNKPLATREPDALF